MSIHKEDYGTVIQVTVTEDGVAVDLSEATEKKLIIQRKPQDVLVADAVFVTDGTDGKLKYVLQANDITQKATIKIQAKITFPTGRWHSDIMEVVVADNITIPVP